MKRKGSIFIVVLITMSVVMVSVFHLLYLTKLQGLIAGSSKNKIQSYLLAETKVNRVLYDEYYKETKLNVAIFDYIKNPISAIHKRAKIDINPEDLEKNDTIKSVNCTFYDLENRKYMQINTGSDYLGVISNVKAYGPIVEEIFELGIPLLSNELDFQTWVKVLAYYDKLNDNIDLDNIPAKIKTLKTFDHNKITLSKKNNTYNELTITRNNTSISESIKNEIFLIMRNNIYTPIELSMEEGVSNRALTLSGFIYVEGDIRISTEFIFNGILVLKDGDIIIDTPIKPIFKGLIITDNQANFKDDIDMYYESTYIYRYGVYLPGFINPKIEVLKKI